MSLPPGPPPPGPGDQPDQPDQPGPYGQPAQGQPGPVDQPGRFAQPGQPGYGYPVPGYSGHPGQSGYGYPAPPPTNGKATAALITGITTLVLSWCCGAGVLGVIAIVLGVRGRSEIRRSGGTQSGEGIALAGIITGAVAVLVGVIVIAAIIALLVSGNAAFQEYGDSGTTTF